MDVRYLISLRRRLSAELEHVGRVEEAESEFDRIRRAHYEARPFDPDGWARLKQGRSLEPSARAVLREVFVERDRIAAQLDRAPYRVMHESALVELARRRPRDEEALRKIKGLNRAVVSSHGRALLEAIRRSDGVGPIPMPRRRSRRSPAAGLTPEQSAVFEALRAWRAPRAEERGVDVARVAPSALLETIARAAPTSLDALARVDGMEPWRVREYGEEIVEIVRSSS